METLDHQLPRKRKASSLSQGGSPLDEPAKATDCLRVTSPTGQVPQPRPCPLDNQYLLEVSRGNVISLPVPIIDKYKTTIGPVANNLWLRRKQACRLTTDQYFRSVAQQGYHISWLHKPALRIVIKGKTLKAKCPTKLKDPTGDQFDAFLAEHLRMVLEGASEKVRRQTDPPSPDEADEHVCTIFAIHQKDRFRAIFNMKFSNFQMMPLPFKMTGVAVLRSIILPGDWMISIDLKDAYLNIRIHKSQCKYQRYAFQGWIWQIVTLPFGNAQAPYAFTRFIKALLRRWRERLGIRCLAWLDDIIGLHQCPRHLAWAVQQMLDDLSYAGLKVNGKVGKSTIRPTQDLIWVGMRWLARLAQIKVPTEKLRSIRQDIGHMLQQIRRKVRIDARQTCRLLGRIQSVSEAVLPQRLYARPILRALRSSLRRCKDYSARVHFSEEAISNLHWLHNNIYRWNGARWSPPPSPPLITIITDASPYAWGAILRIMGCLDLHTSGFFSLAEGRRWQNIREALGVKYAVQAFWAELLQRAAEATKLDPLRILIKQDNMSVVSYIRKMGGPKEELSTVVEPILQEGLMHHMRYLSEWMPGTEMPADAWSRELALHDTADWEVDPRIFAEITRKLNFLPTLDLFASRLNRKCDRYYSFRCDPGCEGVDALSDDKCWRNVAAYAAPPPHLIPRMLQKIRADRARVLVFLPLWPLTLWWNLLQELRVKPLLMIPLHDELHPATIKHRGADPRKWTGRMAIATILQG